MMSRAVIRPEGIVVTTALSTSDKKADAPLFTLASTDAEDVRNKLIRGFDRNMICYLHSKGFDAECKQYLDNRSDPELDNFFQELLDTDGLSKTPASY
jgi:hypothetical protein